MNGFYLIAIFLLHSVIGFHFRTHVANRHNWAVNKTATQSTTYLLGVASRAVDGNVPYTMTSLTNQSIVSTHVANRHNWAVNKTATQSTTYLLGVASRAVDGNVTNNWQGQSCSCTKEDDISPWWMVDLGQTFYIEEVIIVNRGDCCGGRLHDFSIEVLDQPSDASPDLCFYQKTPVWSGFARRFPCPPKLTGRYVRISKHSYVGPKDTLTLCEVEVFGSKKATGTCPNDFTLIQDQCYRFSHFEDSWLDARSYCKTTAGADLAVFSSRDEDIAVSDYLKNSHHGDRFYLGVIDYDVMEEKVFVNTVANPIKYTNWAPMSEIPRCLSINRNTKFTWHSVSCETHLQFICETSPQ